MKRKLGNFGWISLSVLVVAGAISANGQQRQPADDVVFEKAVPGPEDPPTPGDFVFISSEMNDDGKLVKGVPYSAQAITESTQTLGDGNRIVNKSTAAVYRDGEGRTRREQTLRAIGPFSTGGEPPQTIFIKDPVSGVSYVLDPRTHTAHKMPPMRFKFQFSAPLEAHAPGAPEGPPPPPQPERFEIQREMLPGQMEPGAGVVMEWRGTREGRAKTESLGKQTIEGVEAEGSRSSLTIPAGEIGNERPIEIVSERWYSPELQAVVMTRHSDPRFGETTYRLTNINRSEPARSLFEVPAGYTLKEGPMYPPEPMRMRTRRPASNPE